MYLYLYFHELIRAEMATLYTMIPDVHATPMLLSQLLPMLIKSFIPLHQLAGAATPFIFCTLGISNTTPPFFP
jgi:hypothetical protein